MSGVDVPGPLTTIFTQPALCFPFVPSIYSTCFSGKTFGGNEDSCYFLPSERCWPDGAAVDTVLANSSFPLAGRHYYSPGVLPDGFSRIFSGDSGGTTTAKGCWAGWSYFQDISTNAWCSSSLFGLSTNDGYSRLTFGPSTASTDGTLFGVIAPIFQVAWESKDLSLFTPASAPVLPTSAIFSYELSELANTGQAPATPASTGPSQRTTGASSQQNSQASSSDGLSTGAKAGIGVGVAAAVLTLIAIVFISMRRRAKRRATKTQVETPRRADSKRPYLDGKPELSATQEHSRYSAAELPERDPGELPAEQRPQEMAAGSQEPPPIPYASKPRAELPAGVERLDVGSPDQ